MDEIMENLDTTKDTTEAHNKFLEIFCKVLTRAKTEAGIETACTSKSPVQLLVEIITAGVIEN